MATNPNATLRYHTIGMVLHYHSDASYLSEPKAQIRALDFFHLSDLAEDPTKAPTDKPTLNGAVHVMSVILRNIMASATETKFADLFVTAKDSTFMQTTPVEMGDQQPPTPICTDNQTSEGIANRTIKQKRSKAIDMRFY